MAAVYTTQPLTVVPRAPSIDTLPVYTRSDPETSSIHSSAPSYVSEVKFTARVEFTTTNSRKGPHISLYSPHYHYYYHYNYHNFFPPHHIPYHYAPTGSPTARLRSWLPTRPDN
jgi:hypothetical protein